MRGSVKVKLSIERWRWNGARIRIRANKGGWARYRRVDRLRWWWPRRRAALAVCGEDRKREWRGGASLSGKLRGRLLEQLGRMVGWR